MGRIGDEIIQQIRDRVDIVDLIGRFISLKKAGHNYKGLCPFHDEKTPSFSVSPDRQTFHCFGCGEGGSAFTFLMKVENLSFPEAARALARQMGIEIPESSGGESGFSELLRKTLEVAQACFRAGLAEAGNPGMAYLAKRGLDPETIKHFEIGFAPDRWDTVAKGLRAQGISAEHGERAGVLKPRRSEGHYDLLRGRVTFPIRDVRGRVIAFGGRAISAEAEPKYLNTPESPLFSKRRVFFGMPGALAPMRKAERAIVVEGYFDLIAMHRAGMGEVVATCGTALTHDHVKELRRRTPQVVLLFDGDEPGQKAMERALEVLLPEGLRVRAALLPSGLDPDDFLEKHGAEALRALIDEAPPALELVIRRAIARGCSTPFEKADAVASAAPLLALVSSPVERAEFVRRLALGVGTETRHVEAALSGNAPRPAPAVEPAPAREKRPPSSEERGVMWMARSLVEHPELTRLVPREELEVLVPARPLSELVATLIDAARGDAPFDLEQIAEKLGDEARPLLWALAAGDYDLDAEAARRTVDETLHRLRLWRYRERQKAITRSLHEPDADTSALLSEKQRLRQQYEKFNHPPMEPSLKH